MANKKKLKGVRKNRHKLKAGYRARNKNKKSVVERKRIKSNIIKKYNPTLILKVKGVEDVIKQVKGLHKECGYEFNIITEKIKGGRNELV